MKPTPTQVAEALDEHIAGLGAFDSALVYTFIVGVLIERSPQSVMDAIELHKKTLARRASE